MKIAVCGQCGSDDVRADAYAIWCTQKQEWVLLQTFDKGAYCGQCDGETTIEWRVIPTLQATLFPMEEHANGE